MKRCPWCGVPIDRRSTTCRRHVRTQEHFRFAQGDADMAKAQRCWTKGCKNTVPREEWPTDHSWGAFCRECLDAASMPYRAPATTEKPREKG